MIRMNSYSHPGQRPNLEDSVGHLTLRQAEPALGPLGLACVCDGVGGHRAGETASSLAAAWFLGASASLLTGLGTGVGAVDTGAVTECLRRSGELANEKVLEHARANGCDGMATTLVGAAVVGSSVHMAWAGDSRAYLFRDGRLHPLTADHSVVAELVRSGRLDPAQATHHPDGGRITRCLGREDTVIDVHRETLRRADLLLLCSDGLLEGLDEDAIERFLQAVTDQQFPFQDSAERLVTRALEGGASDNASVVLAECLETPSPTASTSTAVDGYAETLATLLHAS